MKTTKTDLNWTYKSCFILSRVHRIRWASFLTMNLEAPWNSSWELPIVFKHRGVLSILWSPKSDPDVSGFSRNFLVGKVNVNEAWNLSELMVLVYFWLLHRIKGSVIEEIVASSRMKFWFFQCEQFVGIACYEVEIFEILIWSFEFDIGFDHSLRIHCRLP